MASSDPRRIVALLVLDGWGLSVRESGNAIMQADTPVMDELFGNRPSGVLSASGESVGLPHGLVGNSEVGHLHLGAGRVVKQDLTRINESIMDGTFYQNPVFISAVHHAKSNGTSLHLMGLLSHGQVHADAAHLYALLELIKQQGFEKEVYIHVFADGRDTHPRQAKDSVRELEEVTKRLGLGTIATVSGRQYAMDRAHNWKRIRKVYQAIVDGEGPTAHDAEHALESAYKQGLSDQRIPPTVLTGEDGKPLATMQDEDVVIFFNLRSDRARQLTKPFVLHEDFEFFDRKRVLHDLYFVGMTNFGDDLPMSIAFPAHPVKNAIPEVLSSQHGVRQLYVAEEEKFAHVSYFFRGGSSVPYGNEERVMVDSIDNALYEEHPGMSSSEVANIVVSAIESTEDHLFVMANIPNADVLGHLGNVETAVHGIEHADREIGRIVEAVKKRGGHLVVTADHGNAEEMKDPETGEALTSHTTNPVPCVVVSEREDLPDHLPDGGLENVAPTVLDLLDVEQPEEMTAKSLIRQQND